MRFSKILCACLAAACLFVFVAGNIGCTNNQPAKRPSSNKT